MHSEEKQGWWLIVNPMAGGARLKSDWAKMATNLRKAGLQFEYQLTKTRNHAAALVLEGLKKGYRKIAGVGGDGTNNEIINGLLKQQLVSIATIKYTLLPFGTGNDWSRTHRIPRKIKNWVAMLKNENSIEHRIGQVTITQNESKTQRLFINIVGLAYDAHIVKIAENFSNKKRKKWLYLWLVLKHIWSFKSPKLKLEFNGEQVIKKVYTVNCGICNFAGGGMKIVPHANPTLDFLALTIIEDFPKWRVPFDTPKLFNGKLVNHKYTSMHKSNLIKIQHIQQEQEIEVEADGEYLGKGKVSIELVPEVLKVIVP